jgi:Zn-dependent M28 family amino/carboxypeptidase
MVVLRTRKATVLAWSSTIASYRSGSMGVLEVDVARSRSVPAPLVVVDAPAARAVLAAAGHDLDIEEARASAGKLEHFDLPGTLRIRYHARARDLTSANVVGRIAGSDPQLAREAVVISAHLDHLGVDGSGAIRNGAIDNASGVAELLAIARALTALPRPPRRTVILLATTGEELGLLGAEGFTAHPSWPLDQIVANVNIDQTGCCGRSSMSWRTAPSAARWWVPRRGRPPRSGSRCRRIRSPSRDSFCAAIRRHLRVPVCRR